ncbi:MAG: PKD domain-containing protein [Deltaproteobacteria bacterium]|nr:PKD domain-containing protein [Deltaproteobacteria bacterium]
MFYKTSSPCWAYFIIAGLLQSCITAEDPNTPNQPHLPIACLRVPVIAAVDKPIVIDASSSKYTTSSGITYIFEFGDGTSPLRSNEPLVRHIFTHEGLYTIIVRVVDFSGAQVVALQDISVLNDLPDPPDYCKQDNDCLIGDECEDGICYSVGGAVE